MSLRKFRALVNEKGLEDYPDFSGVYLVDKLIKGKIYTQADETRYCEVPYKREPFFVDDNGCSRNIKYMLDTKKVEEIS